MTVSSRKKGLALIFCLCLCRLFSFAQEYGLVLAGGGGKGAYQVGVWKALNDYGIAGKVTAISGTSVGGLNAALFCSCSVAETEYIWLNWVPGTLTKDNAIISQSGLEMIIEQAPLFRLQQKQYPQVMVTAVRSRWLLLKNLMGSPGSYAHRFVLNDEEDLTEIGRELLATSAFPILCKPVKLKDGYDYIDGGGDTYGGDNIPIPCIVNNYPLIDHIIIVYLEDAQNLSRRIRQIDYESKELIEIIPSIDLGNLWEGTTNFTASRIALLIKRGYEDAEQVLKTKGFSKVSSYWFTDELSD
mgnify:CR=1 FL=1